MSKIREILHADHTPEAIQSRLGGAYQHSYLGDAVLGAIDGTVTTFAVVAGVVGAGFPNAVAIVLGLANLVADGFSMAISNYQATNSQRQLVAKARASEERHIDEVPEGEREEVRQIFAAKGFKGDVLDEIVEVITSDRDLWVDTMLREELGMQVEGPQPMRAAVATFVAFVVVGFFPLLPFLVQSFSSDVTFMISIALTGMVFFGVGVLKGRETHQPKLLTGIETVLLGGAAAALSYLIGAWLRGAFGTV